MVVLFELNLKFLNLFFIFLNKKLRLKYQRKMEYLFHLLRRNIRLFLK